MEARPPEETGPDLRSEDLNTAQETDIGVTDDSSKPEDESCAAAEEEEEGDPKQAATEAEEATVDNDAPENAPENTTENAPENTTENTPENTTENATENTPENTTENAPENTTENATENTPENTTENAPELVLENPEEKIKALIRDEATVRDALDRETREEEPENREENISRSSTVTDDPQADLHLDSEENPELLQELSDLQTEHENLSDLNYQLQSKLVDYFRRKSGEDLLVNQVGYQKYLDILEDLKKQWEDRKQMRLHQRHVDDLLRRSNEKTEQVELEWKKLLTSQREVLISALEQVKSRTEAEAEVQRLLAATQKCEDESVSVRKENFKLNRQTHQLEPELQFREQKLNGEMSYIEFEQLNIENLNFGEKIQECKEDLLKLKRMLPQTGQILMHVKEKLRFVQAENQKKQVRFDELDFLVLHEQQTLTQTMQTRDKLRFDNLRIRQDSGLLGRPKLLRDLEDTEDKREALERQMEMLKSS